MAKSKETFNKRDKEKKRAKQKQEKAEKMQERRAGAQKGKSLEDMMAYIDEDGNLSATPPDQKKMRVFNPEDIQISVPGRTEETEEEKIHTGKISYFNESKGFGFINDKVTGEKVFVHVNELLEAVYENDLVSFEIQHGPKGLVAVKVSKVK